MYKAAVNLAPSWMFDYTGGDLDVSEKKLKDE
jgi:hypothetical protein